MTESQPQGGWHWVDWGCELLGTALLLGGGLSAICLTMHPGGFVREHVPSLTLRLLITGTLFGGTGSLNALAPWGRRSGAHLNPVVTLAFFLRGRVHPADVAGYVAGQLAGALLGALAVLALWGPVARAVDLGVTQPGDGASPLAATAIEAGMTALLVLVILVLTSDTRTARWTPLANVALIALLVATLAPETGTSLNPVRSAGPALVLPELRHLGVYVAGPLLGSLLASAAFALVLRERTTMTAKLFHDPSYQSMLGSVMPVAGRGT